MNTEPIKIKIVYRQPQAPGEVRRCTIKEGAKEYKGLIILLPCGHMAVLDKRWRIDDINTAEPTVNPSIDCHADEGQCWHGWLEKGVMKNAK